VGPENARQQFSGAFPRVPPYFNHWRHNSKPDTTKLYTQSKKHYLLRSYTVVILDLILTLVFSRNLWTLV